MAKPKNPPPTAEQVQCVRDAWAVLLWDKPRIAADTGLSRQQVHGLIHAHSWWSQERAKRQKAHDESLAAQGDECTRRQMRAALAALGAYAVAAEKTERGMVETDDPERLEQWRKVLPPFRDLHHVERVNTGRPDAISAVAVTATDDRSKSLLERLIERAGAEGVKTVPFPGDEATAEGEAAAQPPADAAPGKDGL
jgi:hypothetical protein